MGSFDDVMKCNQEGVEKQEGIGRKAVSLDEVVRKRLI